MSFKITQLLYSFISVIIALFFVFIGIISLMLPWFPGVRMTLSTFIMEDSITIFLFGSCLLLIGIAFIAGTIWGSRRRYYRLKAGPYSVQISEAIFLDYLESYWKQIFPNAQIPCTVKLARNKIKITA